MQRKPLINSAILQGIILRVFAKADWQTFYLLIVFNYKLGLIPRSLLRHPVCNLKNAGHEVTNSSYTTKCFAFCVHLNLFRLHPTACCGWVVEFEAFFLIQFTEFNSSFHNQSSFPLSARLWAKPHVS